MWSQVVYLSARPRFVPMALTVLCFAVPCLIGCGSTAQNGSAADWSVHGTEGLMTDRDAAETALPTAADLGAGWSSDPAGQPAVPLCMHDVDDKAVFAPDGEDREFTRTVLVSADSGLGVVISLAGGPAEASRYIQELQARTRACPGRAFSVNNAADIETQKSGPYHSHGLNGFTSQGRWSEVANDQTLLTRHDVFVRLGNAIIMVGLDVQYADHGTSLVEQTLKKVISHLAPVGG